MRRSIVLCALLATLASAAAAVADDDWLGEINRYRAAAGLGAVTDQPTWDQGIRNHLTYLLQTPPQYRTGAYASAHTENPDSPYYTSSGAQEAQSSDLTEGGGTTAVGAIDVWLAGPFHSVGMLRARLTQVAFANDPGSGYAGLDVIQGIDSSRPAATAPILFPGGGVTTNLMRYPVGESPNPLETCGWQGRSDVGLPLIALLTAAPDPGLTADLARPDGTVASSANGSLCVVDEHTYQTTDGVYGPTGAAILQSDHAVFLLPDRHLTNGSYTATIHQPGQPDVAWSFAAYLAPPQSTAPPTIDGRATVGATLSMESGAWSGAPTSRSQRWLRCDAAGGACQAIAGATDTTYTVAAADAGGTLRAEETATNDGGPGAPATSAAVAVTAPSPVGRAGRPGYRRAGGRIALRWYAVPGAVRYRVTIVVGGRTRSVTTAALHLTVRVARWRTARVTLRAIGAGGRAGAPSRALRIPAG